MVASSRGGFDLTHSVDSLELAEEKDRRAREAGPTKAVLCSRLRKNYLDTLELRWSPRVAQYQDAEKVRQQRSRIVQTLNVPQRVRLGPSLASALLDSLFEHPDRAIPSLGALPHVWQ